MTTRRQFVTLAGSTALLPRLAKAQAPKKPLRIGFLTDAFDYPEGARAALEKGLGELGYVDGKTLVWEARFANGRFEQIASLAGELLDLNVDIIIAGGAASTLAAKNATSKVPVIMITGVDPVARGFVRSLAHPGGNVTGLISNNAEIYPKRMDILCELAPKSRRMGWLVNPGNSGGGPSLYESMLRRERNVELLKFGVRTPPEIDSAFRQMKKDHVDSLIVAVDYLLIQEEKRIADLAIAMRLPSIGGVRSYATNGGLATYDGDYSHLFYLAATYVDKIAKDARPGDLAVNKSDTADLWINQRTAGLLGITIPESLLLRASKVIL